MSNVINIQVIENLKQKFDEATDLSDMQEIVNEASNLGFEKESEVMSHMLDYHTDKVSDDADMSMEFYHGNA